MNITLTVLLEQGRQQRITTRTTSPISEVLEDVCNKQNLNSDMYDLQYGDKILSISSTLNFYHIPNNGHLTLVRLPKEREMLPVQIFLQMEDGQRYSGPFAPMDTLWDIITTLCPSDVIKKENPVIIHLRKEILGENLKTTTLRSLGIVGNSVLFRFFHKTAEQLSTQSVAPSKIKKTKREETKDDVPFFKRVITSIEEKASKLFTDKDNEANEGTKQKADYNEPSIETSQPKIVDNVNTTTAATTEIAMEIDENTDMQPTDVSTSDASASITESCVSDVSLPSFVTESYIDNIEYIGERNALVLKLTDVSTPKFQDPSDDFYKLTIDDAKLLLRDAKESRKEMEEAELSTGAIREQKRLKKLEKIFNRYPRCVVRIQFPNRVVLQGVFKSDENVSDVIKFVANFLKNPKINFFLYTTPPKTVLNADTKLYEIGIPGVLVYFGVDSSSGEKSPSHYLKNELMKKIVTPDVAQNVANFFRRRNDGESSSQQHRITIPSTTVPLSGPHRQQQSNKSEPKSGGTNQTVSRSANQSKVPKWFKRPF